MAFTVTAEELKNELEQGTNVVIIDVRFDLQEPEAGRRWYMEEHLPGAVYLDLNKDLSSKPVKHGGNHPLPDEGRFAKRLGDLGIDRETKLIIYDQENDMYASRCWWLLYYMGHEEMYILEGGFSRWKELGYETTDQVPHYPQKQYNASVRPELVATMEEVKEKIRNKRAILIDSRSKERYLGLEEPLYEKAGHIPGAKHYFWKDVFTEGGKWKDPSELEKHFQTLPKGEEIIVSCGSGVSACPNFIALKLAGYEKVKLYPGSFSDWISYEENEVATGEE